MNRRTLILLASLFIALITATSLLLYIPTITSMPRAAVTPKSLIGGCDEERMELQVKSLESKIDWMGNVKPRAISIASSNPQFMAMSKNLTTSFYWFENSWSHDSACNMKWESMTAIFFLNNDSIHVGNLYLTMKPDLSSVINVTKSEVAIAGKYQPLFDQSMPKWGGYTFFVSGLNQVRAVTANWTLPSVSEPDTGRAKCITDFGEDCDLAIFVGLATNPAAENDNLVQAGSRGIIPCYPYPFEYCGSASYYLWWEISANDTSGSGGMQQCASPSVSPGDTIKAKVQSETVYKQGDLHNYEIYVWKYPNSLCNTVSNPTAYNMDPYYGIFVGERTMSKRIFWVNNSLAKFSSFTMYQAAMWDLGYGSGFNRWHSIYDQYNLGYYDRWIMANGCGDNIYVGPVTNPNYGSFTGSYVPCRGT